MHRYLLIALGGALGSLARFTVQSVAAERIGVRFPVGTLLVNLSACFIIGLTLEFLNRHNGLSPAWRYLVPVGFVGAYSTFSTLEWEVLRDMTTGAFWSGLLYLGTSIVLGLIAVALGAALARVGAS